MTKRKSSQNRARRQERMIAWISYAVVALVLTVIAVGTGYYFGYQQGRDHTLKAYAKERAASERTIRDLRKTAEQERTKALQEVLRRDGKKYGASHEYSDESVAEKPVARPLNRTAELPKLAIIIDDVAFARDVRQIKALDMPLTMSFLPPSEKHPDSAKLAAKEPYYMVHLPLEAKNFNAEESSTLRADFSQDEISRRITEIKRLFPKVEFVNNHTGSTFTADETAVNRLITALDRYHIGFIDSRTTADTKVPDVMQSRGRPYLARDLFLDHHSDVASVKKAIRRAVRLAKKHGSAIAIGHPHVNTLEALYESKELLKAVQLVRMDHYF